MVLSLLDNGNKYFQVRYEGENNYDVERDDDVYNGPSDEKWKTFLYDHGYYNHYNRSLLIAHCVMTNKN